MLPGAVYPHAKLSCLLGCVASVAVGLSGVLTTWLGQACVGISFPPVNQSGPYVVWKLKRCVVKMVYFKENERSNLIGSSWSCCQSLTVTSCALSQS